MAPTRLTTTEAWAKGKAEQPLRGGRGGTRGRLMPSASGLIDKAATSGQAVVLTGEPGIGKTALLGPAGDLARGSGLPPIPGAAVHAVG